MKLETTTGDRTLSLTVLEKSIIGLFSAITFAMLSWVTITTNNTSRDLAVIQTSIAFIQKDAEQAGVDRFTGNQGRDLERRITALEGKHN